MSKDKASLTSIINIGPKIAENLGLIGINNSADFLARDPYDVFRELLDKVDPSMCRCALASLVGARIGIKWNLVHKQAAREFEERYPEHRWKNKC